MSQAGEINVVQNHPDIPTLFIANIGSAVPLANELEILGTGVISTTGSGNVITISTTGLNAETLTGNTGGAVPATANNINTLGTGSITIAGNPGTSTLVTQLTGLTNHNVLVGAGTATITNVSPSTAGFILTSNGLAADPSFQSITASGAITTLTGNSGGAISPTAGNINTIGTGSITIAGSGSTLTTQLTGLTNHAVLVGAGTATITNIAATANTGAILQNNSGADPSYSTATYPSTTTINQLLYSSAANTVTGLATANRAVLTTGTTGIPVLTALATDGQLIIGSTAGVPAAATLTAGSGITITNASNSITIAVAAGSVTVETLTGNSGGAISPTTGNINTLGTGSITIAGSGSTLTTQLTGLTNHSLLVGAGTATITNLGVATNGQLPIGSSAADPVLATLTAGMGISITNGAGSITISSAGGGVTWSVITANQTAAVNNGYFCNKAGTLALALPATSAVGDVIEVTNENTALGVQFTQASGQQILIGNTNTTSGATGTLTSSAVGDTLKIVCKTANTIWRVTDIVGNWTPF